MKDCNTPKTYPTAIQKGNRQLLDFGEGTLVFFGGIPKLSLRSHLIDYFRQFGEVLEIFVDSKSGSRSYHKHYAPPVHRGSGFVRFRTKEGPSKVMEQQLHQFEGVQFEVRIPLSKQSKEQRDALIKKENRKLYVADLPNYLSRLELHRFLSSFGPVEQVIYIRCNSIGGVSAFVIFKERDIALSLIGRQIPLQTVKSGECRRVVVTFESPLSQRQLKTKGLSRKNGHPTVKKARDPPIRLNVGGYRTPLAGGPGSTGRPLQKPLCRMVINRNEMVSLKEFIQNSSISVFKQQPVQQ